MAKGLEGKDVKFTHSSTFFYVVFSLTLLDFPVAQDRILDYKLIYQSQVMFLPIKAIPRIGSHRDGTFRS